MLGRPAFKIHCGCFKRQRPWCQLPCQSPLCQTCTPLVPNESLQTQGCAGALDPTFHRCSQRNAASPTQPCPPLLPPLYIHSCLPGSTSYIPTSLLLPTAAYTELGWAGLAKQSIYSLNPTGINTYSLNHTASFQLWNYFPVLQFK